MTPADSWPVSRLVSRLLDQACQCLRPSRSVRGLSVLATLLVLLLGVLSVSPILHECCHDRVANHDTDCDHHCVVTDFATGEAWFTPPVLLNVPSQVVVGIERSAPAWPALGQDGYRLQPACGPPV